MRDSVAESLYQNLCDAHVSSARDMVESFISSYISRGLRECFWLPQLKRDLGDLYTPADLMTYYWLAVNRRRPSNGIILPKIKKEV